MKSPKTILITGASSGIGFELAKQYSKSGINLLLMGRNEENLIKIKDTLFNIEKIKYEATAAKNIDIDFKTDLIKHQDLTIEELNESKNKSELTAILASAFLIIISLLAVSLFRNNHALCHDSISLTNSVKVHS